MKIGIAYCGGCNPRYERTTIVARLREDFAQANIVRAGEAAADVVVIICGCHVACASHQEVEEGKSKLVLTRAEDYEKLRSLISTTEECLL